MSIAFVSMFLGFALVGAGSAPGHDRAQGADSSLRAPLTVDEAREAFNRGYHEAAARAFDRLHKAQGEPLLLHYAAVAWAASGDDTRAILRWRRFLNEADADTKERKSAEDFVREAYKRTTALSLIVEPWEGLIDGSELLLIPRDQPTAATEPLRLPLGDALSSAEMVVFLAPGRWTIRIEKLHPGYSMNTSVDVKVSSDNALESVVLPLTPRHVKLTLQVVAPRRVRGPLRLSLSDVAAVEPPKEIELGAATPMNLYLRVGTWRYRISDPASDWQETGEFEVERTTERLVIAGNGDASAAADDPRTSLDRRPPKRLTRGLFAASAATGALGLGLLIPTTRLLRDPMIREEDQVPQSLRPLITECPESKRAPGPEAKQECVVSLSLDLQGAGVGLLAGSFGLAAGTGLARIPTSRRTPQWAALTLGIASALAGALWLPLSYRGLIADLEDDSPFIADSLRRRHQGEIVGGSLLLGLGSGLALGAGVPLVKPRARRSRGARARIVPALQGGSVLVVF